MVIFKASFTKYIKVDLGLKGGILILIFIDNDPLPYKLSCCGDFVLKFFPFFVENAFDLTVV